MADFPNGVGQITLAQMQAGEAVTADGFVFDEWTFGSNNSATMLPGNTVVHFAAGAPAGVYRPRVTFTASFVVGETYYWSYRVTAPVGETIATVEIDLAQAAGTSGAAFLTLNTNTPASAQPHQKTASVQKVNGAIVQSVNVPVLTLSAGATSAIAANEVLANGPITSATNQWSR